MRIIDARSAGPWIEFTAKRKGETYLVIYHKAEEQWTVLKIRPDGEREIMTSGEAGRVLHAFPKERALASVLDDEAGGQGRSTGS